MYQLEERLIDSPDANGFCEAYLLTKLHVFSYPFERDKTAKIITDRYVQRYDCYVSQPVGTPHPILKKKIGGTISCAKNTDLISGTGTTFTSDFLPNDIIWINGQKFIVESVTNDTNLVITELYTGLALTDSFAYRAEAYLSSEESFEVGEDGLLYFNRIYATIPEGRIEWGTTGFTFPAFRATNSADTTVERNSFNEIVVAKKTFRYIRTDTPETDLSILPKFVINDPSGNKVSFVASDTTPSKATYQTYISESTYLRSAETKVVPFRGNIWELQDQEVLAK